MSNKNTKDNIPENIPTPQGKYDDIINLPHYVSKTRKQMLMSARAAQFAPFAALKSNKDPNDNE